ncbi:MAG: hypothetical protein ACYTEQ_01255 [Planctomycetota bacterium]|jgi:hypothetical protein
MADYRKEFERALQSVETVDATFPSGAEAAKQLIADCGLKWTEQQILEARAYAILMQSRQMEQGWGREAGR